jgi:hypothetical protein
MSTIKIEIEEGDQDHFWLMMEMFAANSRFWIEASHSTQAERELGRIRINAVLRFMRAARNAKRSHDALQILEEREADVREGKQL